MGNINTKQNNALEQALNKRYQALAGNKYNSKPVASVPESTTEEKPESGGKIEAVSDYLDNSMLIGADATGSTKEHYRNELAKLGYIDEYRNIINPEEEGLSHRLTAEGRAYSKDMTENGISEDTYDYARSMYDSYNLEVEKDELAKKVREKDWYDEDAFEGLGMVGKRIWTWAKEKWNETDFGEQQDDYNEQKEEEHTQEVNKLKVKAEQSNEKGAYWSISTPNPSESENDSSDNNETQTNKEDFVIFDLEGKEITDVDLRNSDKIDEALSIMASTRESIIDSQIDPETGEFVESSKINAIRQMSYRDDNSNVNKVFNQTKSFFDLYSIENLKRIADSVSPEYKTLKDNEEFKLNAKDWTELQKEISNAFLSHRVIEKKLQETDPQDAVAISDLERQLNLFDPNTIVARYMTNRLDDRISWAQSNIQIANGFTDKMISEIGGTVALCKVLATADYNSEDGIVEAVVNDADVRYWNNVATTGVYETEDSNVSGVSKFAGWALGGVSHALKTASSYTLGATGGVAEGLFNDNIDINNSMMQYARNNTTQQQVLEEGYMRANKGATSWENENSNGWSAIFNENILGTVVEQTGSVLASALTTKGVGSALGLAGKGIAVAGGAAAKGAQTIVGNGIMKGVGKVLQRSSRLADTGLFIEKQSAKLRNLNSQLVRNNISKAMDKLTAYGAQGIGTTLAAANEGTMNGIGTYDEVIDYVNESMDKYILDELDKYLKSGKASDSFKALSPEEQYQKVRRAKINKLASIERDGRSRARDAAAVAFATTTITNIGVGNMLRATTKLNNYRAMRDYSRRSRVSTHNNVDEAAEAVVRNSRTPKVFRAIQRGTNTVKEYAGVPLKEFYEEWNPSVWGGGAVEASEKGIDAYNYSLINGLDIYQEGQWMAQSLGHFFGSSVENMASAEALSEGVLGALGGGAQINPLYVFSYGSKVLSKERIQQARTELQKEAKNGKVVSNFKAFRKNAVDSFKLFTEENVEGLINISTYNAIKSAKTRREQDAEIEKQKRLYDDFLTASVQRAYCGEDVGNNIGRSRNLMLNRIRQRKLARHLISAAENGDQDRFEELRNLSLFEDVYTIQQLSGSEIRAHRKNIEVKANYENYGIKIDTSEGRGKFVVNENFRGNKNEAQNIANQLNKELEDIIGNDPNSDVDAETVINSYKEMLSDFDAITEMQKQAYKDLPTNTPEYVIRDYTRDLFFNRYLSNKINSNTNISSQDDDIPNYDAHNYFRASVLYDSRRRKYQMGRSMTDELEGKKDEEIEALKEIIPPSDPKIEDSEYLKEVERYLGTHQGKARLEISKIQVRRHMESLKKGDYHKENGFLSTDYSKNGLSYIKKDLSLLRAYEFMYNAERYLKGENPTYSEEDFVKKSLIYIKEKIFNSKNDGEFILEALSNKNTKDISFMKGFISAMDKVGLNNTTPDGIAIYEIFSSLLSINNLTPDKLKNIKEKESLSKGIKVFIDSINDNEEKQSLIKAALLAFEEGVNSGEYLEYITDKCYSSESLEDLKKPFNHTLFDFLDHMSKKHSESKFAKQYKEIAEKHNKYVKTNTDEDVTNDAKQINDNNDDVFSNQAEDNLKNNLETESNEVKQDTEEDSKQKSKKEKNDKKEEESNEEKEKKEKKKVKIIIDSSERIEVEISESDKIEDIISNFIKQIPEEHSLYNRIGYNETALGISSSDSSINIPLYSAFLRKLENTEGIPNHIKLDAGVILSQIAPVEEVLNKGIGVDGGDINGDIKMWIEKEEGVLKVKIENKKDNKISIAQLPLGLFYSIENRFEREKVNRIEINGTIKKHTSSPITNQKISNKESEFESRKEQFEDFLDKINRRTIYANNSNGQSLTENFSIYVIDKEGTNINLGIDPHSISIRGIAEVLKTIYGKNANKETIRAVLNNLLRDNNEESLSAIVQYLEKSKNDTNQDQEFIELLQNVIKPASEFSIIDIHALCFNEKIDVSLSPTGLIKTLYLYGMNISSIKTPNNNIIVGYSIELSREEGKPAYQNTAIPKEDSNVFGEQQQTDIKDVAFASTDSSEAMPNVTENNSNSLIEITEEEIAEVKAKLIEIKYIDENDSEKNNNEYIKYVLQCIAAKYIAANKPAEDFHDFINDELIGKDEDIALSSGYIKNFINMAVSKGIKTTIGECSTGGCK